MSAAVSSLDPAELSRRVKLAATDSGFELCGIAPAVSPVGLSRLDDWLEQGFAGEMGYIARRREAYSHPENVQRGVRSLIVCAMNYRGAEPATCGPGEARVARYAWSGADYHDFLRARLHQVADTLHALGPGTKTRVVVDTAPLLERDFARLAGLGWFGKNTMLIHKRMGSRLLLGAILNDAELAYDQPHETSHCGTCTRCLEACPTDAFPEPGVLDARKCISYLTIELRSPIPAELRPGIGGWLFGCDVCQDVCPWNHKPPRTAAVEFIPRGDLNPAGAAEILNLSASEFHARFDGSPLDRPGYDGLRRNAAIVLGNTGGTASIADLAPHLGDPSPLVRGAVAWALGRIGGHAAYAALNERIAIETDETVLNELHAALGQASIPLPNSSSSSEISSSVTAGGGSAEAAASPRSRS
ncbi:MAG TPA: tRNA epoxyqueuosine(34) reductase QueG [Planctomycetaceae bacterium]|nr:tRNA epoxyqueuosine(34) reductase QueG [Planctomycetaceae bacterium]